MASGVQESATLSELYDNAFGYYEKVIEGDSVTEDLYAKALASVVSCQKVAAAADLYSKNEGVQEFSTKSLKVR